MRAFAPQYCLCMVRMSMEAAAVVLTTLHDTDPVFECMAFVG